MKHNTVHAQSHTRRIHSLFHGSCFTFHEKGFSLMELTVAVGIFAVVVTITSSTFITSLKGQQKAITAQNVADNSRYAMEVMAKEMRMGKNFVVNGSDDIQFDSNMPNRAGKTVRFYLNAATKQIVFDDDINDGIGVGKDPEPITAVNASISGLRFTVSGAVIGSQPRITIVMNASASGMSPDVATSMTLQTTISPRLLQ